MFVHKSRHRLLAPSCHSKFPVRALRQKQSLNYLTLSSGTLHESLPTFLMSQSLLIHGSVRVSQAALKLSWRSSTKLLIHFGDAPAHGTMYHNGRSGDSHPSGDPTGMYIPCAGLLYCPCLGLQACFLLCASCCRTMTR
jgi:hypothetical protein